MKSFRGGKNILFLQIFLLLILPIVLIVTNIIPFDKREWPLIFIVLATAFLAIWEKMSLKELGIRIDNLRQGLLPYAFFTVVGSVVLIGIAILSHKELFPNWWTFYHLQWAFLPISAVQEFVYRGYFQTKLQKVVSPIWAILTVAFLYSGMHILWKDPLILVLTFIGGLAWGYLWYKYPNLILISISHAILNYIAVLFQFFTTHLGPPA